MSKSKIGLYHINGNNSGNIIENIKAHGFDAGIKESFDFSAIDFMHSNIFFGTCSNNDSYFISMVLKAVFEKLRSVFR